MLSMFFIVSKILPVVIDPVFVIFCFFSWMGLRCKLSRMGRFIFVLVLIFFYCASATVISDPLFTCLEGHKSVNQEPKRHFDAAIVLCGMVSLKLTKGDYIEFGPAVDRILMGIDMIRRKQADYLVISGGSGELISSGLSEARVLKAFAIRFGVPEKKILIDPDSRNTRENALMTKALVKKYKLKKLALITSAFHMPRAMGCFRAVGLSPVPISVDYHEPADEKDFRRYLPSTGSMGLSAIMLHELSGIVAYGLLGYAVY